MKSRELNEAIHAFNEYLDTIVTEHLIKECNCTCELNAVLEDEIVYRLSLNKNKDIVVNSYDSNHDAENEFLFELYSIDEKLDIIEAL